MGTAEDQTDFDNCLAMYDTHLIQSYSSNDDVEFVAGCGQQHNEAAWSARLPEVYDYLLPSREDVPELSLRDYPPQVIITSVDKVNHRATINYTSLFGFSYTLERSTDLSTWAIILSSDAETLPWTRRDFQDQSLPNTVPVFWRIRATPAP